MLWLWCRCLSRPKHLLLFVSVYLFQLVNKGIVQNSILQLSSQYKHNQMTQGYQLDHSPSQSHIKKRERGVWPLASGMSLKSP